ncbi:hypothetical protein Godav_014001 [Gossypium davidsonii]|uniref:Uncharacterized protein n=1 Tax=Gossypium davidsonii TaxID=34287 RepID=A0A7J8RIG4_GOSDV|nr:hypothetical protein [Gossypium davidsonii]
MNAVQENLFMETSSHLTFSLTTNSNLTSLISASTGSLTSLETTPILHPVASSVDSLTNQSKRNEPTVIEHRRLESPATEQHKNGMSIHLESYYWSC